MGYQQIVAIILITLEYILVKLPFNVVDTNRNRNTLYKVQTDDVNGATASYN